MDEIAQKAKSEEIAQKVRIFKMWTVIIVLIVMNFRVIQCNNHIMIHQILDSVYTLKVFTRYIIFNLFLEDYFRLFIIMLSQYLGTVYFDAHCILVRHN